MPQVIEVPGYGQVEFPDEMNDEQISAAIQKTMIPPSIPADETPEWAGKYPTAYGVYGAGKEIGKVGLEAGAMALGGAGGAIAGAPLGPAGMVGGGMAGAGLGYASMRQAMRGKTPTPQEVAQDIGIGMLGGAATPAAGRLAIEAAPAITKISAALRGKVAEKMLSPEALRMGQLAKSKGIPVTVGDITRRPLLQKAEIAAEDLPFSGMSAFRAEQSGAAESAAKRLRKAIGDVEDVGGTIQAGIKSRKAVMSKIATKKYDEVAELAKPLGEVPATNMNKTAYQLIQKEMEKQPAYQDPQLLEVLQKYTTFPKTDWQGLREIRSDIGKDIRAMTTGKHALIGEKGVDKFIAIKRALEKDMEVFAKSKSPELEQAWKAADTFYAKNVVPFNERSLAKAAESATPDEIYKTFIQRGLGGDRASLFYDALSNKGRQAVRYKMVDDAIQSATSEKGFSPARFAQSLEGIEKSTGVFFKGMDKAEVDGLIKIMRHVERAGQYMEKPPTGTRVLPYMVGGAAVYSPAMTAGVIGGGAVLSRAVMNPMGKKLLVEASKAQPGSATMEKLYSAIGKLGIAEANK